MPAKSDIRAAFAICAAIIGAGFASGREIVSFFACFGAASFLGAAAASAGVGALVYAVMLLSARTQSASFPQLYGALMGKPCEDAVSVLHSLLCLITASAMLAAGAELGALTFPIRHSHLLGFLLTLFAALAAVLSGFRTISGMGALLVPLTFLYFFAMATRGEYPVEFAADGFLPAVPMGLIYAAFNGALAGGTVCSAGLSGASPAQTARLTGGILFILLICADSAMLRAGDVVRQVSMPSVVLAANWGVFGYYASISVMWLSILTTLTAMLHTLASQMTCAGVRKLPAVCISLLGAALISVCGFSSLVSAVYPLLGWVCGFTLVALMLFLPGSDDMKHT